VNRRKGYF